MNSLPNDIEPIIEIINFSFYYFIALVLATVLGLYFLIRYIYKYIRKNRDNRKVYVHILKTLDWKKSKETAYKITKYGRFISGERSQKLLDELILQLEVYKYRKDEKVIENEIQGRLNIFLEVVKSE